MFMTLVKVVATREKHISFPSWEPKETVSIFVNSINNKANGFLLRKIIGHKFPVKERVYSFVKARCIYCCAKPTIPYNLGY